MELKQKPNSKTLTAEWLHDELMSRIEPELMLCNREMVEEMYRLNGETAKDKKARLENYEKAYEQYETLLGRVQANEFQKFKQGRTSKRKTAESEVEQQENQQLNLLDFDINAA